MADTLYNADGSLASGRVTLAWPTFLIGSCQIIGGQTSVTVANGAFTAQLYPNTTAVPPGTSYRVTFALKSGRVSTEYWVVPVSATSVSLATVRAPSVPVPAVMFGESQVINLITDLAKKIELPAPCAQGKILESNGSSTPPQVSCVDPSAGSGSQHQVNGANLASNSPVNFQDSSSIAFTNPSAGNVQASLSDGAVTAAKLTVSSPSSSQLTGVGDSNIAAAALSPNRVSGTAVTQSRAINTTSPITGGGDLSADRTIACPSCEVNTNKGAASGYAALDASAKVVEDPANAQTASAASKIPLADGAGKIADGWLSSNVSLLGSTVNLANEVSGILPPANGGTGANNSPTSGHYLRADGTNFVTSSVAAAGAGACTNQFVRATVDNAAPTCATVTKTDASATFVHSDQSNSYTSGTQDFESASVTRPFRRLAFASFPGTCTPNREFLERSDPAAAGQVLYVCNAAGNGWDLVGDGGGGGGGLGDPGANGVVVRTALDTTVARSISGTANQIVITNGDGVGGNPVIDVGTQVVQTDQGNTWTAGSQDLGSATSLIVPKAAGAAPTADGDARYDTTQKAFAAGGNGAVTGFFPRLLKMTNCTTEANCTSTNEVDANNGQQGTTETNFASNWSMPANFLFANKAIQVCGVFKITSTSGAPTLIFRLKAGSTVLVQTATVAPLASQTNRGATQCYLVQGTAAAGASVSVEAGFFGTTIPHAIGSTGYNAYNAIDQPVTGIATNGALTIQISAQWGTATNGNTIQLHQFYVLELN